MKRHRIKRYRLRKDFLGIYKMVNIGYIDDMTSKVRTALGTHTIAGICQVTRQEESRQEVLQAGADYFIGKPFHAGKLALSIGRLLA